MPVISKGLLAYEPRPTPHRPPVTLDGKPIAVIQYYQRPPWREMDADDKRHPYNQVRACGHRPEDFGVKHPLDRGLGDRSRNELLEIIHELRKQAPK